MRETAIKKVANGSNGNGNGRGGLWAQVGLSIGGGVIIGLSSAALYLGGSLRQIDVNTARLTMIEVGGSQPVGALRSATDSLGLRVNSVERDIHDLPNILSALNSADGQVTVRLGILDKQITALQNEHIKGVDQAQVLMARIATDEAAIAAQRERVDRLANIAARREEQVLELTSQVSRLLGQTEQKKSDTK